MGHLVYCTYILVVIVTTRLSAFMLYLKKRGGTNAKLEMNKWKRHVIW